MARPTALTLGEKYRRVQAAVDAARGADRRHFDFAGEVEPGVRLVVTEAGGKPLVFSLWTLPQDIAELCSDASVPATAALLAIDEAQAREARAEGVGLDSTQLSRSQSRPDVYYALFDLVSPQRVHTVLHRIIPTLEPHATAA